MIILFTAFCCTEFNESSLDSCTCQFVDNNNKI